MDTFLDSIWDTAGLVGATTSELWAAWSPWLLALATAYTLVFFGSKMVRQARANAAVRAERRARAAYCAEVIDLTSALSSRRAENNIA